MKKRKLGSLIGYGVMALVLIGFVYQILGLFSSKQAPERATYLLYQASSFQIELLNVLLHQSEQLDSTSGLEPLKNSVSSASYTHERLTLAFTDHDLHNLDSLPIVLQYITRLQIGGNRPLLAEESAFFGEISEVFSELVKVYSRLLNSNGELLSLQNEELKELDEKLHSLIQKKAPK